VHFFLSFDDLGSRRRVGRRCAAREGGRVVEKSRIRSPHGTRSFDGGDNESPQGANRPQAGIAGAVFGSTFRGVPARKDNRTAAAAALAAGFFGTGEADAGRAQVIDQQQIGRWVFDRSRLAVQVERYVVKCRHKSRKSADCGYVFLEKETVLSIIRYLYLRQGLREKGLKTALTSGGGTALGVLVTGVGFGKRRRMLASHQNSRWPIFVNKVGINEKYRFYLSYFYVDS
jgi:hypothetical protein